VFTKAAFDAFVSRETTGVSAAKKAEEVRA
jgi:hypothetical protein